MSASQPKPARDGAAARRGRLWVIAAPSGAGKTSLVRALLDRDPRLRFSISYTTRPPRGSEQNGREYYFVSRPEFERMIAEDQFLEHAEVFGIIGDEPATNIWRAVLFDAAEKFEQLRGLEMLEQVTTINSVAFSGDLAEILATKKLEDVDLEIFDAELFVGGDRFGMIFHAEAGDSFFF